MEAANRHQDVPSTIYTTTNPVLSDQSTPTMSVHLEDDDLENATRQSDQQKTTELVNSESPVSIPNLSEKPDETASPPTPSPPGPPPDGGLHAWLTVLGAFCGLFVSFGWINCMFIQSDIVAC